MKNVRNERTNWRDSRLEEVHKQYGYDCSCDNSELLMAEYDMSTPVAVIDYRLKGRLSCGPSSAVLELCSNREDKIPYFICEYEIKNNELCDIVCSSCNSEAQKIIDKSLCMTEKQFVQLLYAMRDRIVKGRRQQGVEISETLSIKLSDINENWHGQILSNRHREYGWDCPVVDIDFIVVNDNKVKAIVEYKNKKTFSTPKQFRYHPTGKTLFSLTENMNEPIPLLFVYYDDSLTVFKVYPITYGLNKFEDYFGVDLSRDQYFEFLKKL